jgi:hypothetical protein
MKDVTRKALRMNANQRRSGLDVTDHKCHRLLNRVAPIGTELCLETVNAKLAPSGRKIR